MPIEISGGGSGGGGSGTVTNVSSANTAIAVANPTTTPVLTVATLDVLATDGPPAASVPMNTQKLTGLAAGTTAGDSVRYEQALLSGAVTAADTSIVVGGTGVAPTIRTNTLDVIAADHAPAADWSNNSHKITGLANGSAATDAAAFGQIPTLGQLSLVYRFTVVGSVKASIDTGVDTPDAGSNVWTNGDLLEVYFYGRTDQAAVFSSVLVTLNNDTSGPYDFQRLQGVNVTASTASSRGAANWALDCAGSSADTSFFTPYAITFPNYTGTVGFKMGTIIQGQPESAAATNSAVEVLSLAYHSTTAISRLKVLAGASSNLAVGSQLLIYKRLSS